MSTLPGKMITDSSLDVDKLNVAGAWDFSLLESLTLPVPTEDGHAARYRDVQLAREGIRVKRSCRAATTAALPANTYSDGQLTASANGPLAAQDGITLVEGDYLLVKDEGDGENNGIYELTQLGVAAVSPYILDRSDDFDDESELMGAQTFVREGTTHAKQKWSMTTVGVAGANPVLDTDSLNWEQASQLDIDWGETADIVSLTPNIGDDGGSLGEVARADHTHDVPTAVPGTNILSDAGAAAEGTAPDFLRSDAALVATTAAPGDVGSANAQGSSSSLSRADHTHKTPRPTSDNKNMTASVTASDNDQATATTVVEAPAISSGIDLFCNGQLMNLGDGTKAAVDAYISSDGTAARAWSDVVAGDKLYWNGSVAGFELDAADRLSLSFMAFAP